MKERTEKVITLGFDQKAEKVVAQIEKTARAMQKSGWQFLDSKTDPDLHTVTLTFEREINQ